MSRLVIYAIVAAILSAAVSWVLVHAMGPAAMLITFPLSFWFGKKAAELALEDGDY